MRLALLGLAPVGLAVLCLAAETPHPTTLADVDRWMIELSNWGRWGKADQRGTVNLITPAKRREAAGLVKDGIAISLAHDTLTTKAVDNDSPFVHKMLYTGAHPNGDWFMDEYTVSFHGLAHTHMDSLAHTAWKGRMFNGFPQLDVTQEGAKELAITGFRDGIFSRGVLVDIPWLRGVKWLEPGTAIYPEELDAWEKKTGVRIGSGDVVILRTGRWALRAAKGPWDPSRIAGLHASCVRWLKSRDVAIAGSDACLDVLPSGVPDVVQPVHQLLLIAVGTPIFDNLDPEALAAEAAEAEPMDVFDYGCPDAGAWRDRVAAEPYCGLLGPVHNRLAGRNRSKWDPLPDWCRVRRLVRFERRIVEAFQQVCGIAVNGDTSRLP